LSNHGKDLFWAHTERYKERMAFELAIINNITHSLSLEQGKAG
jgi:hypothetical protein